MLDAGILWTVAPHALVSDMCQVAGLETHRLAALPADAMVAVIDEAPERRHVITLQSSRPWLTANRIDAAVTLERCPLHSANMPQARTSALKRISLPIR